MFQIFEKLIKSQEIEFHWTIIVKNEKIAFFSQNLPIQTV